MKLLKVYSLAALLMLMASEAAVAQSQTDADRAAQQAVKAIHSREVPEASLPCTPDEAKWWNELRAAARAFNPAQLDRPDPKKFLQLIKEGIEKSYQIPVPDHYANVLWRAHPQSATKKNGSIALAVELLPDGTVGEVKIAQGLDADVDQMAIKATRKLVFLPAIKNRKFVSLWMPMTMSFNSYEIYHR